MKAKHKLLILGACIFAGTVFSTDLYGMEVDEQPATAQKALCQRCNTQHDGPLVDIRATVPAYEDKAPCNCSHKKFIICATCFIELARSAQTENCYPDIHCCVCDRWCKSEEANAGGSTQPMIRKYGRTSDDDLEEQDPGLITAATHNRQALKAHGQRGLEVMYGGSDPFAPPRDYATTVFAEVHSSPTLNELDSSGWLNANEY